MRKLFSLIVLLLVTAPAAAQALRVDVDDGALREALLTVREQAGVDVVFSERLVRGKRSTCSYDGSDVVGALACVLRDTGLEAQRVRRNQYVVVQSSAEAASSEPDRVTLAGYVVDGHTDEVLPGAHVYLPDLRVGTVTNEAGFFALPSLPPVDYRVRVSYLGYAPVERRLTGGGVKHTIPLDPATLTSGSILVESEAEDETEFTSVPGLLAESLSRLEALPSFPGESDLFQALQWFPGIRKTGEVNGGMVIRGAPPDQNLYLLDGAPVYHPWHAFSLISIFQTETFKSIKLYRGSFPSEYGGRISSVLDAQMKDGSRRGPRLLVGLSPISARFIVEAPAAENSSFMVAGRRSYIDKLIGREHPVENSSGRRDTLRTGYYFYDASAKFTHRFRRGDRLSVSYYHGGDDLDLRLPFDLSLDFSSWLRPTDLFFEVVHRWENRLISSRYQHLLSDRLFATVTAYSSSYLAREGAFLRPTTTSAMESDYRVDLRETGLKLDVEYFRSLDHQFQAGIHAVKRDFESSLDATIRRSASSTDDLSQVSAANESEVSIYVQDWWQPGDRWTVRPGLRMSVFGGGLYTHAVPGLSFEYAVDPQFLRLKMGVGRHVQYLHRLRDRYAFTYDLVTSRWIPADETVQPSTAYQVSGGFASRLSDGVLVEADAYFRDVDGALLPEDEFRTKNDLVGPGIDVGELLGQYVPGEARAYGIELSARVVRPDWSLRLIYAGGRSLTRSALLGEDSYRSARYDVPRSLRVLGSRELGNWRLMASLDLRSGYPTSVPVAQYVVGDPLDEDQRYLHRPQVNNGRLPPYFRMDLSAERDFRMLGADWTARVHLYNAMNRRNVIARQYVPSADGLEVQNRRGLPILPLFDIEMRL
ncbi:MAG: TonB-dependent receptor [Rhodothermales bacterium]